MLLGLPVSAVSQVCLPRCAWTVYKTVLPSHNDAAGAGQHQQPLKHQIGASGTIPNRPMPTVRRWNACPTRDIYIK